MANTCFKYLRFITNSALIDNKYPLSIRTAHLINTKSCISTSHVNLNENENPFKRTFRIFSDDFRDIKNWILGKGMVLKSPKLPTHCDVLIIGGGVMGFSIAYWLQQRGMEGLKIIVVEKDPSVKSGNFNNIEYLKSTTALSVGGIRQQFSLKENIELSLYSAEFLRNIKHHLSIQNEDPPNIDFNPAGYLFLASEKNVQRIIENVKLQTSLGAKVELLTPEKLKENFPWLNTEDVAVASHGLENEGWFDPWSLLLAFKRKAIHLGVAFIPGEVTKFGFDEDNEVIGDDSTKYENLNRVFLKLPDGTEKSINFAICVIAAGAMSGQVARLAGMGIRTGLRVVPLPVVPRKRYVHLIHCPEGPGLNTPLLIDYTGAYLRREGIGGHYLCGLSPPEAEEPSVDNLNVEENYFEEKVWPIIAHRAPVFEKCKLKNSWAGFYDFNTFDENAFVGPYPGYNNLYLATGFSGHGIQQAPAIGRAVMELIFDEYPRQYLTDQVECSVFLRLHQKYLKFPHLLHFLDHPD